MKFIKKYLRSDYKTWQKQLRKATNNKELISQKKVCAHNWEIIHDTHQEPGYPGTPYSYKRCVKCDINKNGDSFNSLSELKDWEKENNEEIIKLTNLIKEYKNLSTKVFITKNYI